VRKDELQRKIMELDDDYASNVEVFNLLEAKDTTI